MSNAATLRRDTSILFNRIVVKYLSMVFEIRGKHRDCYESISHIPPLPQNFHIIFSLFNLLLNKFKYNVSKISNKMDEQFRIIEYPLIIVFITIGGIFLISGFIALFLSIELQNYGLYGFCNYI
jgi:NADH-ubiquinone oxidoreductase chain 2